MVKGDISGLRKTVISEIEALAEIDIPVGQIITNQLAELLIDLTNRINREIVVYVNRRGKIVQISVGDISTAALPEIEGRKSLYRLSGIRCIHTHPNGDSSLSTPDISALRQMKFDLMVALAQHNDIEISLGFLTGEIDENQQFKVQGLEKTSLNEVSKINLTYLTTLVDKNLTANNKTILIKEQEQAVLIGIDQGKGLWSIEDSLEELKQLAKTAGAEVVAKTYQKRDKPDSALFLGKGKIQEISLLVQEHNANLVICDDELSPSQQRNLEQVLGAKVIDRTELILDIFAQRAQSHEGKLQVELAQLKYKMPRIGGQGLVLSRLGGGIGTRGPGETKLEVDKRRIRSRINDIEKLIENVKKHRQLHRENRIASNIPTIALVGYTNAGKSTLLNKLTAAEVLAEDKLFATLDPTTRKIVLPNGQEALLTDTVGFIQKLPHQLVSAFRATLEEVKVADLLLHVIDASHINYEEQMQAVISVLKELKIVDKPTVLVFNKVDKIDEEITINKLLQYHNSVAISAKDGQKLENIMDLIETFFAEQQKKLKLLIPYDKSAVLSQVYALGTVASSEYVEAGTLLETILPKEYVNKFTEYIVGED